MSRKVFCPLCSAPFDYRRSLSHKKLHTEASMDELAELDSLIELAKNYQKNYSIKTSKLKKPFNDGLVSSTDVIRHKKHSIMDSVTYSGGAFGQGKK